MKNISLLTALFVFFLITAAHADAKKGEEIYNTKSLGKCSVCHKFGKKKVGPDLAGVTKRATEEWLNKWLANPKKVWNENDPYMMDLKKRMKKVKKKKPGHKTPPLTAEMINDLIDFLKTK
ncbi:MAG: c-type cytochrome [Nitrospinota bacterium]